MTGPANPRATLTIHPTAVQRSLAYLGTGNLPPMLMVPALDTALAFLASSAFCLAAGYLLGSLIAP